MMFPVIDIGGGAFECGRVHGALARERVGRSIESYAKLFASCGIGWEQAQRRAQAFRGVIRDFDSELLEEIDGIAAGAGCRPSEILALNLRTEILPPKFLGAPGADAGECTAIAVGPRGSATGGTLLAQNWDWLGAQREALILLRREDRFLTLTEAGMLAKIGFNRHGFGVCLNILRSPEDGRRPGVAVHVLLRALLARTDVEDAVAFASGLSFAGSSNVLCADAHGGAASLEFSPMGLRVLRPEGTTLCHTNHFLHPEAATWQARLADNLSTEPRLARARAHAGARAKLGLDDLKRMLRDEAEGFLSICRRPDARLAELERIETVASVIMELGRGVMHVAPDIPSRAEYETVGLAGFPGSRTAASADPARRTA